MKLDGMHHLTMITGDAVRNVEFYGDVLRLRLVKKTVNDPGHPGEELRLPSQHEHLRPLLERQLTPLTNPRATARQEA